MRELLRYIWGYRVAGQRVPVEIEAVAWIGE
jgi:hypothetical protein